MDAHKRALAEVCPCERPDCQTLRSQMPRLELRISELEEENARLAASANSFGDLADRLNARLRERRSRGADRRERYRRSPDRRFNRHD